jgi:hypothetical protein
MVQVKGHASMGSCNASRVVSVVTAAGAFSVSFLSVYLGYRLFLAAAGQFKFRARLGRGAVGLESIAPGIGFALFGAAIAIYALSKLLAPNC